MAMWPCMTESEEVAESIAVEIHRSDRPQTFGEALAIVTREMPDETFQVQQNTAYALLSRRW